MPALGLGTFKSRGTDVAGAVTAALEAGYRHIDTASIYKNEAEIACALAASGVPRSEVFITSKVSPYQQGTQAACAACDASLAALGSPIDLMLVHWPGVAKTAADSPINSEMRRQTWAVLEQYHKQGVFKAIGVSNYEMCHLEELLGYAEVLPAVNQVECHPRWQQRPLRAFCSQHNIALVAYSPLGGGQLLHDPAVLAAATTAGITPAQALALWGLRSGCAVLPKSVRPERIAELAPARLAQLECQLSSGGQLVALWKALDGLEGERGPVKYCWDPSGIL